MRRPRFGTCLPCALAAALLAAVQLAAQEASNRAPIPGDAAQAEAMKLIREVYKLDYENAKTNADKQALAKKMLDKAAESRSDLVGHFVLLKVARDIATQAGDGLTAFSAVEHMAETFQVDDLELKANILDTFVKKAQLPADHKSILEQSLILIDRAVSLDRFELADRLGVTGLAASRQAHAADLTKQLRSRAEEIKEIAGAFERVKVAIETLKAKPTDPEANLTVGRYACLVKGDWNKGMSLLALGSDPVLKAPAVTDLYGAQTPPEQEQLGDAWWDVSEKEEGTAKKHLQGRAVYWYKQALPGLTGLAKDKVAKRVGENAPDSVTRVLRFGPRNAAGDLIFSKGAESQWTIRRGILLISAGTLCTYREHFKAISSVTIRGGTVPPNGLNFRAAVGPIHMILNWEVKNENHFRNFLYGDRSTATRPRALTPGKLHEIQVRQVGNQILVTIDGRQHFATTGQLDGTISVWAAHNSTIMVQEIVIEGVIDPGSKVTAPSHVPARFVPPRG